MELSEIIVPSFVLFPVFRMVFVIAHAATLQRQRALLRFPVSRPPRPPRAATQPLPRDNSARTEHHRRLSLGQSMNLDWTTVESTDVDSLKCFHRGACLTHLWRIILGCIQTPEGAVTSAVQRLHRSSMQKHTTTSHGRIEPRWFSRRQLRCLHTAARS